MPLPGEKLEGIYDLIETAIYSLEVCDEENTGPLTECRKAIDRATEFLEDEEMEVYRFGDLTKIPDHNFQPFASIRQANEIIQALEIPTEYTEETESDFGECIEQLELAAEILLNEILKD